MKLGRNWGPLDMKFDFEEIHKLYEKAKETHDFQEYIDEIEENNNILSAQYFNSFEAKKQISKLAEKYRLELNILAKFQNNGMYVTNHNISKTDVAIRNDLIYINNYIPLFAIERAGLSNLLKKQDN